MNEVSRSQCCVQRVSENQNVRRPYLQQLPRLSHMRSLPARGLSRPPELAVYPLCEPAPLPAPALVVVIESFAAAAAASTLPSSRESMIRARSGIIPTVTANHTRCPGRRAAPRQSLCERSPSLPPRAHLSGHRPYFSRDLNVMPPLDSAFEASVQ